MPSQADIRAQAQALLTRFAQAGAQPVEADILQPADILLDLYGEDMRARAYVTSDPLRGEMMLRPDFTVPVVKMHMADGVAPARYAYMGEVFRKHEHENGRPTEYLQAGFEMFDTGDPADADAEVFALFADILAPLGLRAATGDIGILRAAVEGLSTTDRRKQALLRHIWRPRRFRALFDRFAGRSAAPEARAGLLERVDAQGLDAVFGTLGPEIGLRSRAEVETRIAVIRQDLAAPPIAASEAEVLDHILDLRETSQNALEHLRDAAVDLPSLAPAVARFERRMEALAKRNINVAALDFEVTYGRTTMEYYDGFVFGFYAEDRPELPPIATGGRFDALTQVMGQGAECPAVGGVIRPAQMLSLKEAAQ